MKQYQCIRSSLLSGRELVEVIARLEKRYAKGEFNNYRKNSSTCYFLGRTLPSLDPFAEVLLVDIASLAATPLAPEIVMALAQEWGERSQRKTRLAWHLDDVSFDRQSDGKVTISAGLDRHGFYCGVAGIQEQSPGYRDREMRARFFETIVAAMGLSEQVRVRWDGTDLTMEASPPWTLYFPFAQLGGKNPYSFEVAGFTDIGAATKCGEKLAAEFSGRGPSPTFSGSFTKAVYEEIRSSLEDQTGPWYALVFGELGTESKEALAGKFSATTPKGPIPAFDWHTTDTEEQVFGAITVQETTGYLEISVEHRAECDLFEQTAFLSDVTFEEV